MPKLNHILTKEITLNYSNTGLNTLTALTYKGIGKAWIVKHHNLLKSDDSIVEILNASVATQNITTEDFQSQKSNIESQLISRKHELDGLTVIGDSDFPIYRGNVKNSEKPVALFYRGDLSLLTDTNHNIAVIGLLEPDAVTEEFERQVIQYLVKCDITIVSGLANGCDAIAHDETVRQNGKTVAILPSPISNIIPSSNRGLADRIVQSGGLLVTEYLNEAQSKRAFLGRYQERDRLQALFSDGIILTSSYAKNDLGNDSGSRLAMEYAKQYNIQRAVIYDSAVNLNNPKYDLNRQLIRENPDIITISRSNYEDTSSELVDKKLPNGQNITQIDLF